MPSAAITKKADRAFDDPSTHEFGEKYLELLHGNWSEIMRSARRAVFLAVLLVLSFFLLDPAKTATIKLGPLETSNIAAVLVLLPAIISFLLFEAIDLTLASIYYREAVEATLKKLYPKVYDNQLGLFLEPAPTFFAWGGGSNLTLQKDAGKLSRILENAASAALFITWGAALVFFGYAYLTLFEHSDVHLAVLIASLLFTLFNVMRATLQISILANEEV